MALALGPFWSSGGAILGVFSDAKTRKSHFWRITYVNRHAACKGAGRRGWAIAGRARSARRPAGGRSAGCPFPAGALAVSLL